MGHAAVPAYVGQDFSDCPPGHRFSLYFRVWNVQWGLDKDEAKALALREVLRLPQNAKDLMQALGARQQALALALPGGQSCVIDAVTTAPFATGLGLEHPIENGFAFLSPYGLPYLAGSGVKGVLRRAAEELEIAAPVVAALFGAEDAKTAEATHRGALSCWDVLPQFDAMTVEIMTPHQSGYYLGNQSPHEAGQPVPIHFLALPAGATFRFVLRFAPGLVPEAARVALGDWQALVLRIATHAFDWLGFGAKTAVGYGAMAEDPEIAARRKHQAVAAQARREAEAAESQRQQTLAELSPTDRAVSEFLHARADKNQPELAALLAALKRGQWTGETQVAVAAHVKRLMQQSRKWTEKSAKKNPQKDHDHQDTLLVMQRMTTQ
jgi:CRISPR-associated protein Cmr6